MKIFLLEDDYSLNEAIKEILEMKNHIVNNFYDGEIAFDNIDFSQLDIKTLIETKPIQYKINIEDIKEILRDKQNLTYAKNLILA